jgi:hypothetical protein
MDGGAEPVRRCRTAAALLAAGRGTCGAALAAAHDTSIVTAGSEATRAP